LCLHKQKSVGVGNLNMRKELKKFHSKVGHRLLEMFMEARKIGKNLIGCLMMCGVLCYPSGIHLTFVPSLFEPKKTEHLTLVVLYTLVAP